MAQSGGPTQAAAQSAPSGVNNQRHGAVANAPLTNGGLAAPASLPVPNVSNGSSHMQGGHSEGEASVATRVEGEDGPGGLQTGMPSVGNDPDGAKKRNTSFGITTIVVDSRRTSNDPMDDGSGEDDVEDSKTEDISDGKDVPTSNVPSTLGASAQSAGGGSGPSASAMPQTTAKKPEVVPPAADLTGTAAAPAAAPAAVPAPTSASAPPKRKTSTASNAGANQARLQFTMGYTFNIFVYNTNVKSGAGSNSDALRPPSAKVQASAASAYVSDIEVDDEDEVAQPPPPPPAATEPVKTKSEAGTTTKTKAKTKAKTYASAAAAAAPAAVSDAQLLAMFMQNESPKHGPQDRFKFVKIQTAPTKVVSRWTLVDYGNRSGPLAPPPQPFPSNTSPAMSMTKLKAAAAVTASSATTTRAASAAAAVVEQLPERPATAPILLHQPHSSAQLPPTPHPSLVHVPVQAVAAATQQPQQLVVTAGTYVPPTEVPAAASEITGATPLAPQQTSQIRGSVAAAVSAAAPTANMNSSLQQQQQPTAAAAAPLILSPIAAAVTTASAAVYTNDSSQQLSSSQSQYIHPEAITASQTSYIPPVTQSQQQQHGSQQLHRAEAEDHLRLVQTAASQPQQQLQPTASASSPYQQQDRPAVGEPSPSSIQRLGPAAGSSSQQPPAASGHSISAANRSPSVSGEASALTAAAKIDDSLRQQQLVLEQLLLQSGGPAMSGNVGREAVAAAAAALPSWPPIVGEEMVRKLQEISTQQAGSPSGADQDPESASGTNQGAIDNRIERAMDLVKSHLMNAVRSEVEELKDKIKIMEATICNLQAENDVLKRNVPGEVLLQLQTTSLPALAGPEGSATSSVTLPSMSASAGGSAAPSNFTESGNTSGCSSVPVSPPPITANAAPAAPGMAAPTPQMPAAAAAAAQQAAPPPPPAAAAAAPTPPPSDSSAASSHNIQQQ